MGPSAAHQAEKRAETADEACDRRWREPGLLERGDERPGIGGVHRESAGPAPRLVRKATNRSPIIRYQRNASALVGDSALEPQDLVV